MPLANFRQLWREGATVKVHLTVAEAADYMNTTVRFVRRLIAERRIPFHKIGRHVRLKVRDVDAFIDAGSGGGVRPDGVRRFARRVS